MKNCKLLHDKREAVSVLSTEEIFKNHLSPSFQACVLRLTVTLSNIEKVDMIIEFEIAFLL